MIFLNRTKKPPKPFIVNASRTVFIASVAYGVYTIEFNVFPESQLSYIWILYGLAGFYLLEKLYDFFAKKNISLTFAYPLMLSVYALDIGSALLNIQDTYPIINRAEHYFSFIIYTSGVWIFFLKYLPQAVWRKHPYYTSILVFAVTSTIGVLNEVIELTMDLVFSSNYIGDRLDTPFDLLMNSLGIASFLGIWLILGPRREAVAEVIEASTQD